MIVFLGVSDVPDSELPVGVSIGNVPRVRIELLQVGEISSGFLSSSERSFATLVLYCERADGGNLPHRRWVTTQAWRCLSFPDLLRRFFGRGNHATADE